MNVGDRDRTLNVGDRVTAKCPLLYGVESAREIQTIEPGTSGVVEAIRSGDVAEVRFAGHETPYSLWNDGRTIYQAVQILD